MQGVGLHSGVPSRTTVHPASPGSGISFTHAPSVRHPIPIPISATYRNVKSSVLCTSLEAPDRSWGVSTVEHIMAAFAGLGITDVEVEVDGPEVPLLDGGAGPFALALHPMIVAHEKPLSFLRVKREVKITLGRQTARLLPSENTIGLDMKVAIDFSVVTFALYRDDFTTLVAPARTFTFAAWVDAQRSRGLIRGGSLENAIVLDAAGKPVNPPLRFEDEPARHKLLDCIGDLALAGHPIYGIFTAELPSHKLSHELLGALFSDPANYEVIKNN